MGFHGKRVQLIGTTTVGPKGQVVIPIEARDKMGISAGDKVIVLYMEEHGTVAFVSETEMQGIIDKMGAHLTEVSDSFQRANQDTFED